MANPGIVIVKRFGYRGQQEEWSNVYHFSDTVPADAAAWKSLVDLVAAQEKTFLSARTKIVRAYCYSNTDNDSVATVDYTALAAEITGTLAPPAGAFECPGDAAIWVRWTTTKRNTKGKAVYLRKYYHDAWAEQLTNGDTPLATQKAALQAFGDKLATGAIAGFHYCGHDGTDAGTALAGPWITTRTLKRRGKRPPS